MASIVPAPPTPTVAPPLPELGPDSYPDLDELVTEDHRPVDHIFIEKQYRLLTEPLYSSWAGPGGGRPFLVLVNVGWFFKRGEAALVPDCLLSLDVSCPADLHVRQGHSYYQWEMGKPPEVVIEVVSDKRGGEDSTKLAQYARLGVGYYVIFDPVDLLGGGVLRFHQLQGTIYRRVEPGYWEEVGIGLGLWQGTFEGHSDTWLRWTDRDGKVIPTGGERAEEAERRVRELEEALRRLQASGAGP